MLAFGNEIPLESHASCCVDAVWLHTDRLHVRFIAVMHVMLFLGAWFNVWRKCSNNKLCVQCEV